MTPFATLKDIKSRSAEAVIAQSGLRHPGLKTELRALFSGERGAGGCLLAEPVMESAHPYVPADMPLSQVPPNVLDPRFVGVVSGLPETDDYRFPATRKPFRHQYEAWQVLSDQQKPQSVLVTSGTGSGKTECFLFPILSDLTRQAASAPQALEGVQALMLYPLNALIESQKLRLSAWTRPLKGKVRYALYNGDMPQSEPASKRRDDPERVIDREMLRASPPPILVTNVTMLEYMLARIEDQPIIEKSRGKLKWIVLDEAHSLVGAAAAEIALLLRRVLLAFDVKSSDVHFVATSATIGDGANILQRLKSFLAEIGGIDDDQVHVIEGARQLPVRPATTDKLTDLKAATPEALYDSLGGDPETWDLIERLFKAPQPLSAFSPLAQRHGLTPEDFVSELTRAVRTQAQTGEAERLAPMRVHAFERSVPGLWVCLNPSCGAHIPDWPFGRLFSERAQVCPDCQAPVLEMVSCTDCGVSMLSAIEGKDGRLVSPNRQAATDEFALEAALETEAPEEEPAAGTSDAAEGETAFRPVVIREHYLFSSTPGGSARTLHVDLEAGRIVDQALGDRIRAFRVELHKPDVRECPCCGQVPPAFARRGKSLEDWKDYLYGVVTHFIRANRAVDFADVHRHWLMPHVPLKGLLPPNQKADDRKHVAWPSAYAVKGMPAWPALALIRGMGLDRSDPADRQDINDCLEAAWNRLSMLLGSNPDRRGLDFTTAFIAPVTRAFVCPDTRRLIDVAPFGLTPYGRSEPDVAKLRVAQVDVPAHPSPKLGQFDEAAATQAIRSWLANDPVLQGLRTDGQWNNISDRIAGFAHYARSAEHSAQQQNKRLRIYEDQFKDGRINILNCSTTMEMGVDIGSVSTVMMTNVPPSIANYRQRVGRAGRRGQAVSLSFTYCKDRPLDREAFNAPARYLTRKMAPPKVALSSRTIVQRHVNAHLLRAFLQVRTGDALRMQIGAFIGCPSRIGETRPLLVDRPAAEFIKWLGLPDTQKKQADALRELVRRSVLEGETQLCEAAGRAMTELEQGFEAEWRGFQELAREEGGQARQSRMGVELKRLCEDFLLSGLADRGFLPGHGFPNHVVTFIPAKAARATEGHDGARQHRALGPQRSLDLAIRDYAPGSEVVLDGLVHKSAGVTLNWKRPASEEKVNEVQSLSFHWHCQECGASDSCKALPEACAACGSTHVLSTEYLRPAGFSVDPREKAHADTDTVQYVPAEMPRVSTRNTPWRALPWPDTGRLRLSRNGRVFYGNFGPERRKYALCLHCGRAQAEPADGSNPLQDHTPLRWGKTEDRKYCLGNNDGWKIRRTIALGHEISTDVIEIQLAKPLSDGGTNALAISLRESLARELGVEADEMGFATHQMPGPYAARSPSLLLFDKASGGAGFSISLENMLASVLKGCENILDCRTPGCVTGCAACVLTSDAPAQEDGLDRIAALEYLRSHLLCPDDLPEDDRFVPEAQLSVSVLNEIEEALPRLTAGRRLLIYPGQEADPSGLANWPALAAISNWVRRGYPATMVLAPLWLEQLDVLNRQTLRDLALASGVTLATGALPAGMETVFAMISDSNGRQAWASQDSGTRAPGEHWGQPLGAPVARGTISSIPEITPVNLDDLKPRPGAKFHLITKELDQMIDRWGTVMARQIAEQLKTCNIQLSSNIRKITYSDPYVRSPMVARLLLDTVAALQTLNGQPFSFELVTQLPSMPGDRGPPRLLTHNWPSEAAAGDVLLAYAAQLGLDLSVRFQKAPHGRYLNLYLQNDRQAQIILDQGFGAWSLLQSLDLRHNFQNSAAQQIQAIRNIKGLVQRQSYERSYLVAVAE